jgi:hypothetical protein
MAAARREYQRFVSALDRVIEMAPLDAQAAKELAKKGLERVAREASEWRGIRVSFSEAVLGRVLRPSRECRPRSSTANKSIEDAHLAASPASGQTLSTASGDGPSVDSSGPSIDPLCRKLKPSGFRAESEEGSEEGSGSLMQQRIQIGRKDCDREVHGIGGRLAFSGHSIDRTVAEVEEAVLDYILNSADSVGDSSIALFVDEVDRRLCLKLEPGEK